jgi:hypothetical protein
MSLTQPTNTTVTPDLIRGKAFLCGLASGRTHAEGSLTPGQARGDDNGEGLISGEGRARS